MKIFSLYLLFFTFIMMCLSVFIYQAWLGFTSFFVFLSSGKYLSSAEIVSLYSSHSFWNSNSEFVKFFSLYHRSYPIFHIFHHFFLTRLNSRKFLQIYMSPTSLISLQLSLDYLSNNHWIFNFNCYILISRYSTWFLVHSTRSFFLIFSLLLFLILFLSMSFNILNILIFYPSSDHFNI